MNSIKSFIIKNKKQTALLFAFLGVLLIIISYIPNMKTMQEISQETIYSQSLEKRVKNIIEQIAGENTTEVMITLKNTYIATSQSEVDILTEKTKEKVSYEALPLPDIAGVMIVCTTLDNKDDFLTIKKAVSTCLDIPQSKIYIIGGASNHEKSIN